MCVLIVNYKAIGETHFNYLRGQISCIKSVESGPLINIIIIKFENCFVFSKIIVKLETLSIRSGQVEDLGS